MNILFISLDEYSTNQPLLVRILIPNLESSSPSSQTNLRGRCGGLNLRVLLFAATRGSQSPRFRHSSSAQRVRVEEIQFDQVFSLILNEQKL